LLLFVLSLLMVVEKIISLSESVVLISFGDEISPQLHEQVMQAKQLIESNPFEGFVETVPAYNSLAVCYNPLLIETKQQTIASAVEETINQILNDHSNQPLNLSPFKPFLKVIPVCYDQELGIDLEELAATLELSVTEIIQLHVSKTYKVYMTGFTPGFPYMGILDERLVTKRRSSPRVKVEAGSVAIAGNQTGIYPFNTPGGWNIIGRTPLKLFDSSKSNPFLLKAGDEVKFEPITKEQFYKTP